MNIEKIKAAALAATQGEWDIVFAGDISKATIAVDGVSLLTVTYEDDIVFGTIYEETDATHIAAANPSAVLELIERLEETKADLAQANSILIKIEKLIEGVDYRGDYAEGVRVLKDSLEAAEKRRPYNGRAMSVQEHEEITAELQAKLEVAERDAERYRWLRHQSDYVNDAEIDVCKMYSRDYYAPINCMLDDAIDAAMKEKP